MYFADQPPPHFHIITVTDEAAVYLIETLELWDGEADLRDTAEALAWAATSQAELRTRWREYSEEEGK
jgi:hypothetical protein